MLDLSGLPQFFAEEAEWSPDAADDLFLEQRRGGLHGINHPVGHLPPDERETWRRRVRSWLR